MLKKFLVALGIILAAHSPTIAAELYQPYADPNGNLFYNLLFCEDVNIYKVGSEIEKKEPWTTLLAGHLDKAALQKIAEDENTEGKLRIFAYDRLRGASEQVATKKLLGVVVEVSLPIGLNALAAFSDGSVYYLNHIGKVILAGGQENPVKTLAKELLSVSQPVLDQIGPAEWKRLSPPIAGNVRMTFLASDGRYFVEAPMTTIEQDSKRGPVFAKAGQLLLQVVALGAK